MQFNVDKCKMMHFGFNNTRHTYTMENKELQTVSEQKDLGVTIQDNLKVDKQVAASVAKANKMPGMICQSFNSRDEMMMLQLYKSIVRRQMGFAISAKHQNINYSTDCYRKFVKSIINNDIYIQVLSVFNDDSLSLRTCTNTDFRIELSSTSTLSLLLNRELYVSLWARPISLIYDVQHSKRYHVNCLFNLFLMEHYIFVSDF